MWTKVANNGFSFPEKMRRKASRTKGVFLKSLRTKGQVLADASVFYSEYNLKRLVKIAQAKQPTFKVAFKQDN